MHFTGKTSCGIAKDRLKQLVLTDRMGCSPEILDMLKTDMTASIARYMDIDRNAVSFSICREPACFTASVPLSAISGKHV